MKFQPVRKEDKRVLDSFFFAQDHENSHFNFTTVYIWRKLFHIHWAVEDGVLYLSSKFDGVFSMLQPFGPEEKLPEAIEKQAAWLRAKGQPFRASGIEAPVAKLYESMGYAAAASRGEADYLYRTDDLIRLAGRKYHTKKNHLNGFHRSFPEAEYQPITEENAAACKLNMNAWYKAQLKETPDDPFLRAEREGVMDILSDLGYFALRGGAIALGDRIAAFTLGERTARDMAVVHVEKAAPDVRNAYAAINHAFLVNEWAEKVAYVNRQEDMGLDGLRQAKEAYRPVRMVEKFTITARGE